MTSYQITKYSIGGSVRDELLGVVSKDLDYTVVVDGAKTIDEAWDAMVDYIESNGFTIFLKSPQFQTIRAKFPKSDVNAGLTADFVLAREDGPYTDRRRPDWVRPGSLEQDIARRDFTVNALAKSEEGEIIDLWGGVADLKEKILRAVGDPRDRLTEDPLRAIRALRFAITKGFTIDPELAFVMRTVSVLDGLRDNTSSERVREEFYKAFAYDTASAARLVVQSFPEYLDLMDHHGIWLLPTSKEK